MSDLRQNTLEDATTESSFLTTINENAGETLVSLQKEVTLETGETVTVEGISPVKMKEVLNYGANPEIVTFKTPGEDYVKDEEVLIKGVCQAYNETVQNSINHIETYTLPDKLTYLVGEYLDLTGMTVIAVEEDGDTREITDYTVDIAGRPLTTEDTRADISYAGKHVYFTITVNPVTVFEKNKSYSIVYKDVPTKTITEFLTEGKNVFIREIVNDPEEAITVGVMPDYFILGEAHGPKQTLVGSTGRVYLTATEIASMVALAPGMGVTDLNVPENPVDGWYNAVVGEDTVGGGLSYTLTTATGKPADLTINITTCFEGDNQGEYLDSLEVSKLTWLLDSVVIASPEE